MYFFTSIFCFRFLEVYAAGLTEALHSYFHFFQLQDFRCLCRCQIQNPAMMMLKKQVKVPLQKELADKPRTTNGTQLDILQSILLPFLIRCGCWPLVYTHDPHRVSPKKRTAGVSSRSITLTNKSNCLTNTVATFFCQHFAVGRHHRRRTPRFHHGLQLSRAKVFLTDHMHACSWINYKLSFLRLFCCTQQSTPFFPREEECSFVLFFELENVFSKIPSFASGTSLLSFSLFVGPFLKFHRVGTSVMKELWHLLFPTMVLSFT